MGNDVDLALDLLEAQDRERQTGRRRRTVDKSVEYMHQKLNATRSGGEKAVDLVKRGSVSYVEKATSLNRLAQEAVTDDAVRMVECVGQVAGAGSVGEALAAQARYVREQSGVALKRWRRLGDAILHVAGATSETLDGKFGSRSR